MSADAVRPLQLVSAGIGQALVVLSQSFALLAYKRALTPLYSFIPATSYISYATIASSLLGSIIQVPANVAALVYGSLLAAAPNTVFYVGRHTARWRDPVSGPIVTHALVLVPILASGVALLQSVYRKDNETRLTRVFRLSLILFALPALEDFWSSVERLQTIPATEIFLTLATPVLSFWAGYTYIQGEPKPTAAEKPAPKGKGKEKEGMPKKAPIPVPVRNPVQKISGVPAPLAYLVLVLLTTASFRYSPSIHFHFRAGSLKAPYVRGNVTILSSKQSTTGVIVVGETSGGGLPHSRMRYLRASHSLLGGVWIKERASSMDTSLATYDAAGNRLGDSIYPTFVLQTAVRQINSTSRGDDWFGSEALIIGLGAGIAATVLKNHGIETTIVEVDPAVYDAARTYFGLPDPGEGRVFLQDARRFVWHRGRMLKIGENLPKFDVVIHDVFSGGGLPGHLFTLEFWNELKEVMKEDGVAVVNFVGKPGSESSRVVLSTLLQAFGQCRAFYDLLQELPKEQLREELLNIVFFCTPVPATTKQMTFRPSRGDDYFGSYLRQHVFQHLPRREITFDVILGQTNKDNNPEAKVLLTDGDNPLSKWQDEDAPHHWKLMKDVLPDIYWEAF